MEPQPHFAHLDQILILEGNGLIHPEGVLIHSRRIAACGCEVGQQDLPIVMADLCLVNRDRRGLQLNMAESRTSCAPESNVTDGLVLRLKQENLSSSAFLTKN
jgi:hypothetical protein